VLRVAFWSLLEACTHILLNDKFGSMLEVFMLEFYFFPGLWSPLL
jgi:hypothetical protein